MVELVFGREGHGPRLYGRLFRLLVAALRWAALIAAPVLWAWGIRLSRLVAWVLLWAALVAAPVLLDWSIRLLRLAGRVVRWAAAVTAPTLQDWSTRLPRFVVRALGWAAVCAALALLGWGLATEARTSYLQSRLFASLTRDMSFAVLSGPNRAVRFPKWGPYDERLGYAGLPLYISSLSAHHFTVERQAAWSGALARFVDHGGYAIYGEKPRAGARLLDREGNQLYGASYPERAYTGFRSIPPVVVNSLLFIEDRDLLDPHDPRRNPAVEWSRFTLAAAGQAAGLLDRRLRAGGASTLATQTEKFRHSPGGRTPGVAEKFRQMFTASARAYRQGPDTSDARRQIVTAYLNSEPLASRPGYGEIIGVPEALWLWYGTELAEVNRVLTTPATTKAELARKGEVYRQVLSLLLAGRRPAYYLIEHHAALAALTDYYLRLLAAANVIDTGLRDAALHAELHFRADIPPPPAMSFVGNKATDRMRAKLVSLLHLPDLYALDRLDLTGYATVDTPAQKRVTDVLTRLGDPAYVRSLGLVGHNLLGGENPARLAWSVVLYERGTDRNYLRVHADSLNEPFDINSGAKLQLGSTAKLRTLITYLDIIEELHRRLGQLSRPDLLATATGGQDPLTKWAADYLAKSTNRGLQPMLDAAMQRHYSGSPEEFFTGGGMHAFANFEKWENSTSFSVEEGFARSVNNVFLRVMRDITRYYIAQSDGQKLLTADREDPHREAYLRRFIDQDSRKYLNRFYHEYRGLSPDQALAKLAHRTRPIARRLAVVFRSVRPEAERASLGEFLARYLPRDSVSDDDLWDLYRGYDVERFSLEDRGYIAGIHPLELWLVTYLRDHPAATRAGVTAASEEVRQEVYGWLFKSHSTHKQDVRIRILLEQDAFDRILQDWQRQGYPFGHLVPSYGTAIGSSGDRPDALADLMGIILNDGARLPTVDLQRLEFAAGTPYETDMAIKPEPQRVLSTEVATTVRRALLEVVEEGTATRLRDTYHAADGSLLAVGGKTGTGDNRFDRFGADGSLISQRVVDRTATFVFFLGERFFGTITAYVPGAIAGNYHFTSAIAVQLLKAIEPQLEPLLKSPVTDAPPQAISQVQPMPMGFRKPANIETEGVAGSSD
jgi:membrane peptidoglycan carboxypeptidase